MNKQEEIREQLKDYICMVAKSNETDACESCEKLELKSVCSLRQNAEEYLSYLSEQDCEIRVEGMGIWHTGKV